MKLNKATVLTLKEEPIDVKLQSGLGLGFDFGMGVMLIDFVKMGTGELVDGLREPGLTLFEIKLLL